MAASNSTSPDPHTILNLLRSSLIPFYAKGLPTTLQLYAHLQLLSSRIRSEARRAVAEQERLIALLEEEGVDETNWLAHGASRKTDGRTLRRIGAEEGDEELTREDRMMDLSFKLRLYHLALLFAHGLKPTSVETLLNTYFPDLPKSSQHSAIATSKSNFAFIRAMTPAQASSLRLFRLRALSIYTAATDAYSEKTGPLMLESMLLDFPGEKALIDMVIAMAEDVINDYETIKRILDVEDQVSEVSEGEEETQFQPLEEDVFQGMDMPMDDTVEDRVNTTDPGPPIVAASSPPPIHTFRPISKPRSSSTMIFTPEPHRRPAHTSASPVSVKQSPHSPAIHKPRLSGLPPPSGPDYTSPRGSSSIPQDKLKPFSNSKLQHRTSSNTPVKRSRLSSGVGTSDVDEPRREKRRKEAPTESSE